MVAFTSNSAVAKVVSNQQVSFLGKYAEPDTRVKAAIMKRVERLREEPVMRRNAVRRYKRRIASVDTYLSRAMALQAA